MSRNCKSHWPYWELLNASNYTLAHTVSQPRMRQSELPCYPKLCEQSPHPLVPMGLASCCPVVPDDSHWFRMWPRASAHGHWNGVRSSPRNTPAWCFPFKRRIMSCFSIQHCSDVKLHCPHTANGGTEIKEECHLECESATSKERIVSCKQQEVC